MSIKNELIKAERYDDIVNILNDIINTKPAFVPVNAYQDDEGKYRLDVESKPLIQEAKQFLNDLYLDLVDSYESSDDISTLAKCVISSSDMLLHNLGVHLCHRCEIDEEEVEKARAYLTLENLIICLNDIERDSPWTVPPGWYRM